MSFEADLYTHLQADAGIAAVVSERIWPNVRQEGTTLPAITTQVISNVPATDLDNLDGKLLNKRMQIDVWAFDYDGARQLAELVRLRLQTSAATFASIMLDDQDFYESDTRIYRVSMDFSCWYDTP